MNKTESETQEAARSDAAGTEGPGKIISIDEGRIKDFPLQPGDDVRVAVSLCWLTKHIGVEQPAHNLRRRGSSRRRGGTSSMLKGHSLRTESQSEMVAMRRKTSVSSSASN